MWLADHGASGPEVVLAVGGSTIEEMGRAVVRSRRCCRPMLCCRLWPWLCVAWLAPCSVAGCCPGCGPGCGRGCGERERE